jgi:hypothetical protein
MSVPSARRNRRQRGRIEELRSGALRVSVKREHPLHPLHHQRRAETGCAVALDRYEPHCASRAATAAQAEPAATDHCSGRADSQ